MRSVVFRACEEGNTRDVCRGLKGGGGPGGMLPPEAFRIGWQCVCGCPVALAATVEGVALRR
jgi:hypothetical protein